MSKKEPAKNIYFERKLPKGNFLVSTRSGGFVVLDDKEHSILKRGCMSAKNFSRFEKEGIVITKKNAKDVIKRTGAQYSFLSSPAILCVIAITSKCNQSCIYCHADSTQSGGEMSTSTMEKVTDFIASLPHGRIGIDIQGGEPLLCIDAIKSLKRMLDEKLAKHKKSLDSFVIVSNLSKMNDEIADYVLNENIGIATSFDGPKAVHDAQRKLAGASSYDAVTKWVRYFHQFGKDVSMTSTITNIAIKCGAKNIIKEYLALGANTVNMRPAHPLGRAKGADFVPTPEGFFSFWKNGLEFMLDETLKGRTVYDRTTSKILANILCSTREYMCFRMPCGAGISQLAFNPDGDILACDFARSLNAMKLGHIDKSSYADILLNSLELRCNVPESIAGCDTCAFSPYCGTCACKNYSESGDIAPRIHRSFDCKFNSKVFEYLFDALHDEKKKSVFEKWIKTSKNIRQ